MSKRSRPPDRKKSILVAAEALFIARGYEHVTLEEIADSVGIVPSALYRHFSGRSEILSTIVKQASEKIHEVFLETDFADPEKALVKIAQFTLDNKSFGVIWGREVKHLPVEQRLLLHPIVRGIESEIAIHVHEHRPDLDLFTCELVTASIFAVLLSPSFNHLKLSRDRYVALLTTLSLKVLNSLIKLNLKIESDLQDVSRLIPYSRRLNAIRVPAHSTTIGSRDRGAS
jgi:AcrR family transcriptional regulator